MCKTDFQNADSNLNAINKSQKQHYDTTKVIQPTKMAQV